MATATKTSASKKTAASSKKNGTATRKTTSSKSASAASQRSASSAKRSSASAGKKSSSGNTRKQPSAASGRPARRQDTAIYGEIAVILLIAFCVFLFCSNLGLCGQVGQTARGIMRGCLGIFGYLFPVFLPLCVIFMILSRDKLRMAVKTAAAVVVYTIFCGIVELILDKFTPETFGWMDFYTRSQTEAGGGLAGAIWCRLLYPSLGAFGSYLVLVVLALIGLLLITEKSLLRPIRRKGERMYSTAREDMERRKEEREIRRREREAVREEQATQAREERRYRRDNPVKGVNLDIRLDTGEDKEITFTDTENAPAQDHVSGAASSYTGSEPVSSRNNADSSPEKAPVTHEAAGPARAIQEMTITGLEGLDELNRQDIITARQDKRTLSELESLDSLHSGFSRRNTPDIPEILYMPDDRMEPRPDDGSPVPRESVAEQLQSDEPLLREDDEEPLPLNGEEASAPDTQNARGGDTLRVVTASGRVIEVDNDPTIDPLSAKRAGLSQGQAAMTSKTLLRSGGTDSAPRPASSGSQSPGTASRASGPGSGASGVGRTEAAASQSAVPAPVKKKLKPYEKPPLRLLNQPQRKANAGRESDLRETAMKLQQTLQNFGVGATVTNISCGPSVTRYELIPDQGVKVSKFLSLTDDIKLNLAAADIRMEAPIPGKSAIGIEVPNRERASVGLREVLESEEFLKHPSKLAIAVGKDIAGNNIVADLARMPHLLVAGTTGSGKSVCINCMIVSMLYKATPDEVKFIMIDPKMVEFGIYNGIPHLLSPVVTDPKKAAEVLNWAVLQMTDRYKKFAELNVRDIKGYNEKQRAEAEEGAEPELMPQIVIIVDELSDLMMAAPSEVEDSIVRLAQMARAAGIHLILATQRPTVNVVTGLIKANIPSRVALSVSTGVDSRTIIDMNGAEKLLGNGDMLFYPSGYQKPLRVQGAYVSDGEINEIVSFLSERGEAKFDESIETRLEKSSAGTQGVSERDEYFERAGRFIVESQKASIGNLQRMFKIGFNRAARIMDQLAEAGVVGSEEGTKARKILMTPEQLEEYLSR